MPSWVPGQETKPAPMPLLLVQSFVNTWDADHGSDLLLDPAAARDWLTRAGLWSTDRAGPGRAGSRPPSPRGNPGPAPRQHRRAPARARRPAAPASPRPGLPACAAGRARWAGQPRGRARRPARSRAARPAADDPGRTARSHLAAAQGVPQPGLPVGLLRPLPQPGWRLVRHDHLRQPDQKPQAPATAPLTG